MYLSYLPIRLKHPDTDWRKTALASQERRRLIWSMRHSVVLLLANDWMRDRSHLRSSIVSVVQSPFRKFPFFWPRGAPGLDPPCKRHRLRPRKAGRWHGVPARVFAPHRGARLRFASRLSILVHGLVRDFLLPPQAQHVARPHKGLRPRLPFQSVGETVGLGLSGSVKYWSEWQDLNLRPPRPERGALPDCATLRH